MSFPIRLVNDDQTLMGLLREISDQRIISYDTETTGTDWRVDVAVGASLAWGDEGREQAIYFPWAHCQPNNVRWEGPQCSYPVVRFFLETILRNPYIRKVMHNAKFDIHLTESTFGWKPVEIVEDTMLMAFMVDSDWPLDLKQQTAIHFTTDALDEETALKAYMKNRGLKRYAEVPPDRMASYACSDAFHTLKLYREFLPEIEADYAAVYSVERKLVWVTQRMERTGIKLDADYLKSQYGPLDARVPVVTAELESFAWKGFNPNSDPQVRKLLFDQLHMPVLKRTEKGEPSTAEDVLLNLPEHPALQLILEARTLKKTRSTYLDGLLKKLNWDGRCHGKFNQTGAGTGRFSSSEPNLQNIPREGSLPISIRSAFVPDDPDSFLAFLDYKQAEMYLFAHHSNDPGLIAAVKSGYDFHLATAINIYGVGVESITKPQRKFAKRINFGIVYGEGSRKLALELQITVNEAKEFMELYFRTYPGSKRMMKDTRDEFERTGFVTNVVGRKRKLPDGKGYRAVNTKIQGGVADLVKSKMVEVDEFLRTTNISMMLTIHDELVFGVHRSEAHHLTEIKRIMENFRLRVPIRVDLEWSEASWGQKRPAEDLKRWLSGEVLERVDYVNAKASH